MGATAAEARVLFARVAGAIEALPDGEREALLLFAWEDLPYQGVAEALELPVVLPVIGYLGMAAFFGWPGIVFGLLIQISRGLGDVLFLNALNEKISLAFRATLLSVAQLGTRASFALMGPLVGYGIDAWGLASVLSALGILSAVVFVLLLLPLVLRDLPQTSADSLTGQPAAR